MRDFDLHKSSLNKVKEMRCLNKLNLSQRMKYPDCPEKFMDSEVDLDDAVQDLFQSVNAPELYPVLVETGALGTLLLLLNHENKDIAADVIQLLASLTDTTDNEEYVKPFQTLVSSLLELNVVELLVLHLQQRTEASDEDAAVIFNILTALDNMIDVMPDVAQNISQNKQVQNLTLRAPGNNSPRQTHLLLQAPASSSIRHQTCFQQAPAHLHC